MIDFGGDPLYLFSKLLLQDKLYSPLNDAILDPKRDTVFVEGPVDVLDHAAPALGFGSKFGIDATRKWRSEGFEREWPEPIVMDEKTKKYIDSIWEKLGIS